MYYLFCCSLFQVGSALKFILDRFRLTVSPYLILKTHVTFRFTFPHESKRFLCCSNCLFRLQPTPISKWKEKHLAKWKRYIIEAAIEEERENEQRHHLSVSHFTTTFRSRKGRTNMLNVTDVFTFNGSVACLIVPSNKSDLVLINSFLKVFDQCLTLPLSVILRFVRRLQSKENIILWR